MAKLEIIRLCAKLAWIERIPRRQRDRAMFALRHGHVPGAVPGPILWVKILDIPHAPRRSFAVGRTRSGLNRPIRRRRTKA
jgi:hypothetical protein